MKKTISMMVLVCFLLVGFTALDANTNKDYKVLKKSLKDKKGKSSAWLRISVTEGKKEKVMIKVPLALIELFSDTLDEKVDVNGSDVKIKDILKVLTDNGPQTLVEISNTEENEIVKIWIE